MACPESNMILYTTRLLRWRADALEFLRIYNQYRKYHGIRYSLGVAWSIVERGTPF